MDAIDPGAVALLTPPMLVHDRYRIVRLIGKGGMGAVYEAVDQRLNATVAVKQRLMRDAYVDLVFRQEAHLLASLRHPALPRVTDYFTTEQGQFLVMEFFAGDDLGMLLKQQDTPFPLEQVLDWASQVLQALHYLHSQQPPIIHRDIKPQNLKLTPHGQIVILDFGLSKGLPMQTHQAASIQGYTPHYAPPEQIEGSGTDARSDLYSLSATLYVLLTATRPPSAITRMSAHMNQRPDPLRPVHEVNSLVPIAISSALHQALALSPEVRPGSAHELLDLLRSALPLSDSPTLSANVQRSEQSTTVTPPALVTPVPSSTLNTTVTSSALTTSAQHSALTESVQHAALASTVAPNSALSPTVTPPALTTTTTPPTLPARMIQEQRNLCFWGSVLGAALIAFAILTGSFSVVWLLWFLALAGLSIGSAFLLTRPVVSVLSAWLGLGQASSAALTALVLVMSFDESVGLWICFAGLLLMAGGGLSAGMALLREN